MSASSITPIWPDDEFVGTIGDADCFQMPTGQSYCIARTLAQTKPDITTSHRIELTEAILQQAGNQPLVITTHNIAMFNYRPSLRESANRVLNTIIEDLDGRPGTAKWDFKAGPPLFEKLRRFGLGHQRELLSVLNYLEAKGLIGKGQAQVQPYPIPVSVENLIKIEELGSAEPGISCFVAMWFAEEMNQIFDQAISPAIAENGFDPVRIDQKSHNNKIDDEIVAEIRRAHFVVADFTCGPGGARGGVYYEAGLAAGLGKPVIFTVRSTDLGQVHFDTRQFNHIVWEYVEDLRAALSNRIAATIAGAKRLGA